MFFSNNFFSWSFKTIYLPRIFSTFRTSFSVLFCFSGAIRNFICDNLRSIFHFPISTHFEPAETFVIFVFGDFYSFDIDIIDVMNLHNFDDTIAMTDYTLRLIGASLANKINVRIIRLISSWKLSMLDTETFISNNTAFLKGKCMVTITGPLHMAVLDHHCSVVLLFLICSLKFIHFLCSFDTTYSDLRHAFEW